MMTLLIALSGLPLVSPQILSGPEAMALYRCANNSILGKTVPRAFTLQAVWADEALTLIVKSSGHSPSIVSAPVRQHEGLETQGFGDSSGNRRSRKSKSWAKRTTMLLETLKVALHYELRFPVTVTIDDFSGVFAATYTNANRSDSLTIIVDKSSGKIQPMFRM